MAIISSEKELEDFLFSLNTCDPEHPLGCAGKCLRQVDIKGYGVIDLLYIDINYLGGSKPTIILTIVELKKDIIDFNALGQICRYRKALERYFENTSHSFSYDIGGILVGSGYGNGDICFAVDNIDWLSCYHYTVNIATGIEFEESCGWYNKGENFKNLDKISSKFISEYIEQYKDIKRYTRAE